MIRRALLFGALAAGGAFAWTLIEFLLGWHTVRADVGRWTGFAGLVFPVAAIVLALRSSRAAHGGRLPFGRGLAEGTAVSAVAGVLGAALFWVYYARVNPGFLEDARARGEPVSLEGQLALVLASSLVLGALVSLVVTAVLRRRGPTPA